MSTAYNYTGSQIAEIEAEDHGPLVLLAAAEAEARLMPGKISRVRRLQDEPQEAFEARVGRLKQEMAVVKAISNSTPERVLDGLKALARNVPGLVGETDLGEVMFATSQHHQMVQRVVQRLVRQACSMVMYNERSADRRKERDQRWGPGPGQFREDDRMAEHLEEYPEDAPESFEDQFRGLLVEDQISALEALYHRLSMFHEALNVEIGRNWPDHDPRLLSLFSVQRQDGSGQWQECTSYAEARQAHEQSLAARAQAVRERTQALGSTLDAIF